jgi:hypothetical protein
LQLISVMNAHRLILLLPALWAWIGNPIFAGVLPDDRADAMYHYYDGDNVQIDGPSLLVRKNFKETVSLYGNYYVDSISSASIDVVTTGASAYSEERNEYSLGLDYLHDDTIMSVGFGDSDENDYKAQSLNLTVAQEMFGGLTMVTMGYARGSDEVFRNGPDGQPDGVFEDEADRRNYRLSVSQVLTRNLLMGLYYEAIADEGYLNNPYRQVRYVDLAAARGYSFEAEIYPRTRSSNAIAVKARYHLPYRAAVQGGYRFYSDSWGIDAHTLDIGYTHPFKQAWLFEAGYRFYTQSSADFYSDLFPFQQAQNFLARDKELSTFVDHTIRVGVTYDFLEDGWKALDRGTLNLVYDHIIFDYDDFLDIRDTGTPHVPGTEPTFNFSADVIQLFVSIWF